MFGAGETVTILTTSVTGRDALGDDVLATTSTEVAGCALAPSGETGRSSETVQGRDQVTVEYELYAPTGTVISAYDRVVARGDTYEVSGSPNDWSSPFTGTAFGVVVKLKRVSG